MTSLRPPDVSLYELATGSGSSPPPLQISPTTFKSLIGIVVDLLIEQQIPATLWLKLPKGELWQAEIERLYQAATVPYTIYALQPQPDRPSQPPESTNHLPLTPLEASDGFAANGRGETGERISLLNLQEESEIEAIDPPAQPPGTVIHSFPLAATSQLRREYFLMVATPDFYGLLLAHRPRSVRAKPETNAQDAAQSSHPMEEGLEQKHPLLGLCSFDASTLQRVLDGVNQAIKAGHSETRSDTAVQDLLVDWEGLNQNGIATSLNPLLVGQFLTKQVQRQEEIWRSGAVYRRQAEQANALRLENEELLSGLRLKDEFVKTMGQELRTPLTNMKTALSLLNSPQLKPPQKQRYMDMISRECDRQSLLITSVLDLIQLESSDEQTPMEALRLIDLVPGVVSTYQPLAQEKGLMLGYTVPEDLPPVSCINQWLKQMVIHLLHNSIKFTQTGGQVWVKARQQAQSIQLEFRDTGIGIAQADIPRIFDRFYRARSTGDESSGVGLGLSIVQELVRRCQGSISVKSKPGEGSVFCVQLPIYRETEADSLKVGETVSRQRSMKN
ncbi:ATP-binding protein [Egbenema bharatensis]|uniref:ATP-binding protein n=1 Tax=Egbenema bharatensis TaxID=3463334 RepID=UPI003A8C35E3